jgi:hypothetical protein
MSDLKYDGVYMSGGQLAGTIAYSSYLRFYPDGDVIAVGSTATPEELQKWFDKESDNISRGKFIIQGNHISFHTVSTSGNVDYIGEIHDDQISLNWYSHINQGKGNNIYVFVKW